MTSRTLASRRSAIGYRRRLLAAIAALTCATPSAKTLGTLLKLESSEALDVSAERRPLTVMFCDLVGSTALASRLDAEDWRSLVNAYLDEASAAVTGLGGHVLKRLGDGLMALFGYPLAQENDGERAVRAALVGSEGHRQYVPSPRRMRLPRSPKLLPRKGGNSR